ncbi:MAG: class I SAM-dependent methyltransferase [Betaproteobacteria bacterium]|nr:MAG: class I SAM-dependent methyltransferase [Betaproteobacteria bacterium]
MTARSCRLCSATLNRSFCDLGMSPLSNAFLNADQLNAMEPFYPLHAWVCEKCFLVQLEEFESPAHIFGDYAYFSSYSDTWLAHARDYVERGTQRFGFGPQTRVVELASNDGYLLQYFKAKGIPVLGIEPAANVAKVAEERGVPTLTEFFGSACAQRLAAEGKQADLVVANNVLAHVPPLNDFVAGISILLAKNGIATIEVPHLLRLIQETQFDTIYHEHFSYFSLLVIERLMARHALRVFDVEELRTHGGSLRLYICHAKAGHGPGAALERIRRGERDAGLHTPKPYDEFQARAQNVKHGLLEFLVGARRSGKRIVGYGAAAKGNTLLNYCGVGRDFIDYVVDRSPHKQGKFLPGTHLRIEHPDRISVTRPDYLLVLPWNIRDEIIEQNRHIRSWGGKFLIPMPAPEVVQ